MDIGRRRPAHFPPIERHNTPVILLVTVCSKNRKPIFAEPDVFPLLTAAWHDATSWRVGRFVVMPNHIHLFCAPAQSPPSNISHWIRFWKSSISRKWPRPDEQPIWHAGYWDRQIRRGEHYGDRWEYVRQNPVRAGFVQVPDEWPWQGELNELRW
jgi:putative transposase